MNKKYFMFKGEKVYLKEEGNEVETPETPAAPTPAAPEAPAAPAAPAVPAPEAPPAPAAPAPAAGDELNAEAKAIAASVAKEVMAKMDLKPEKKLDSKMAKILNGKDLSDKDALTAEEKIVGFYHALVTGDKATAKALSEGVNADGGFLFPDEFRAELIKNLVGPFRMRGLVRVVPMRRDVMNIPLLTSRPKLTWTAENETKSTTTAHFGQRTITARKLAAILYSSDELIEDSTEFDVVKIIIDLFADAIADEEDKVILQGNGTTQPTGIVTAVTAGTYNSTAAGGNLSFDTIINLFYDLPQAYRQRATWVVATANVRELRKLKDNDGRYLWQDSLQAGEPSQMLGKPVIENDYVGEATILFGDLKLAYALGDRKSMAVKVSQETETAFTKDQTAIRVVSRIGGNVWDQEALRAITAIP